MPILSIHFRVMDKFKEKVKVIENKDKFYLGGIMPDAVNAYGFASKVVRFKSHLRNDDLNIWKENVTSFYKQNKGKYEKDYLLGFVLHLFIDIIWDERYDEIVRDNMIKTLGISENKYEECNKEMFKFSYSKSSKKWFSNNMKSSLLNASVISINDISIKDIEAFRDKVIKEIDKSKEEEDSLFITEDIIESVTNDLINEYKKQIEDIS